MLCGFFALVFVEDEIGELPLLGEVPGRKVRALLGCTDGRRSFRPAPRLFRRQTMSNPILKQAVSADPRSRDA